MWKLSTSIIYFSIIIMGIIQGLSAVLVSVDPEMSKDLSLHFGIPMDKCSNSDLEVWDLSNMGVKSFQNYLDPIVKMINLENNEIVDISPEVFNGHNNLICLNIGQNYIKNLFQNFLPLLNINSLTKLNLAQVINKDIIKNKYKRINFSISIENIEASPEGFLPSCTHLDISGNNLIDLPLYLISLFPRLTHIYLSDNNFNSSYFDRIPETTKFVYLERNNQTLNIEYLPENITLLFLNENNITNEKSFRKFKHLKTLSISKCNNIEEILNNLRRKKLHRLDISYNNLGDFYLEIINRFPYLRYLSLDHCSISIMPSMEKLKFLKYLSMAYNDISVIEDYYFGRHVYLRTLNLRGNRLVTINESTFTNMIRLENLDLSKNKLTFFDPNWMKYLSKLQYLNVESNMLPDISTINISNSSSLKNIFFSGLLRTSFPFDDFNNLPSNLVFHATPLNISNCDCS